MHASRQNIIVVCGPTATGKSDYAVELSKKLAQEGTATEIISADSRQVYKGLDIGSGKITTKEMRHVPHHLLDVANPKRVFSVVRYKKLADKIISALLKKNITPIIVGGTGFYIDAIVFDYELPSVPPNKSLRTQLAKQSLSALQEQLQELDPERYSEIDTKNSVRLIRAIEISTALGKIPPIKKQSRYNVQWIYLDLPDEELKQRIHDRLIKRMRKDMVKEVEQLHADGVSWKRLEALGLEYRFIALYLQDKIVVSDSKMTPMQAMLIQLETAIWQYVKRQRTWFKKYAK